MNYKDLQSLITDLQVEIDLAVRKSELPEKPDTSLARNMLSEILNKNYGDTFTSAEQAIAQIKSIISNC